MTPLKWLRKRRFEQIWPGIGKCSWFLVIFIAVIDRFSGMFPVVPKAEVKVMVKNDKIID
jgi:hypothetical protein